MSNPFWEQWYENISGLDIGQPFDSTDKIVKDKLGPNVVDLMFSEAQETTALGLAYSMSKHMAQSQLSGRLGMAARVTGKIGLRVVPVVGYALLAYDVYRVGSWLYDEYFD